MNIRFIRHLMLSLAMCLCSAAAWALDKVDGAYLIGSADDLQAFAELVLEDPTVNGVLTADIDITDDPSFTIATASFPYAGTFDGGYHSITIALESSNAGYCALFRKLGNCTVRNLNVRGTILGWGKYCCGLAATVDGNTLIENTISWVNINSEYDGDASHSGFVGYVSANSVLEINNCAFAGSIKGEKTIQCAGMIGWAEGKNTLSNVMVIADFEIGAAGDGTWGNLTFARNPSKVDIHNGVYLHSLDNVEPGTTQITEEDLTSGVACFAVNGMSSENPGWFQTLGEDPMPVPNPAHGTVYCNGRAYCDGTAYVDEVVYSNTYTGSVRDEHEFEDGICQNCQTFDPTYMTPAEDGYYEIGSFEQLFWFATKVNAGDVKLNARLTAPINMDGRYFPSIGNKLKLYGGTFDGQMQPITGTSASLFGTTDGATLQNIALESGEVMGRNASVADHTGTIIGVANNTSLTHSYSKANITLGNEGDCGGIVGKFDYSNMKDVAYLGTCTSAGWSHAGIAGSGGHSVIADCFVMGHLVTTGGEAKGAIVGWGGAECIYNNCVYLIEEGFAEVAGHLEGTSSQCTGLSAEEIAAGQATWQLNGQTFVNPTWYQTLEEDPCPVLDATHDIVFKTFEDEYVSGLDNYKSVIVEAGKEGLDEMMAAMADIKAYDAALDALDAAQDNDAFAQAYQALTEAKTALDASAAAYREYLKVIDELQLYLSESYMPTAACQRLADYVEENEEPSEETFPNGSFPYIEENRQLSAEQIAEEAVFARTLMQDAIKGEYKKGDEVTGLLVNADLSATTKFDGWTTEKEGSTLTTASGIMTTAEFWNATGDVHQTITGLKNGIYELRAYAATRPNSNIFNANDHYIAYLYANQDEVFVQALTEDMVSEDEAIDGENCDLARDQRLEIDDVTYYVPYGPATCAPAFRAGRYLNSVLTNVTDGSLTVGLRLPGTGLANDWMGFADFRLFYLGTAEDAEGMDDAMANYASRAKNLIAYTGSTGTSTGDTELNYRNKPNFSNELRDQLQAAIQQAEAATTPAEKLAACAHYTELFHKVDTCKQAYISLIDSALFVISTAYADANVPTDIFDGIVDFVSELMDNWQAGKYTYAEAVSLAGLKETDYYKYLFSIAPPFKDGYFQIATADHLVWFSNTVNSGNNKISGELVAPIDLTDADFHSIGTVENRFQGTFRGNLHPITNLGCMLFGTADGVTIDGVNIQGGVVEGNAQAAAHTGALVGYLVSGTVTRCYSSATVQNGTGDCGGMFGKVNAPVTISNCMFAGDFTSGWSAGGIAGSTNGNNAEVYISDIMIDARNITYKNGDAHGLLVGWLHDGLASHISNIWYIEAPQLSNIAGHSDDVSTCNAACTKVLPKMAASGQVAYALNHGNTENPVWFQTIGEDTLPTFSPKSLIVYSDGETFFNKADQGGDVNGDGAVTIKDVVAVLEIMAADGNDSKADINGDGAVTIKDVVAVLEIMAAQ